MAISTDKQKVRAWLKRRVADHSPPPSPEQIRRELGWHLISSQRDQRKKK